MGEKISGFINSLGDRAKKVPATDLLLLINALNGDVKLIEPGISDKQVHVKSNVNVKSDDNLKAETDNAPPWKDTGEQSQLCNTFNSDAQTVKYATVFGMKNPNRKYNSDRLKEAMESNNNENAAGVKWYPSESTMNSLYFKPDGSNLGSGYEVENGLYDKGKYVGNVEHDPTVNPNAKPKNRQEQPPKRKSNNIHSNPQQQIYEGFRKEQEQLAQQTASIMQSHSGQHNNQAQIAYNVQPSVQPPSIQAPSVQAPPIQAPQPVSKPQEAPQQFEQNSSANESIDPKAVQGSPVNNNSRQTGNKNTKPQKPKEIPTLSNTLNQQKNPENERGAGCGVCNGTGEGKRKIRCRNCPGCKATKCGKCTPCTRPTMKKPCLETVCQAYVIPRCPKC